VAKTCRENNENSLPKKNASGIKKKEKTAPSVGRTRGLKIIAVTAICSSLV
jgi:hypothetical protein